MSQAEFDSFAPTYEQDLARSLAITGEGRSFYAQERIEWTTRCIVPLRYPVRRILDYGCGDGANALILAEKFKADQVLGVDVSSASIAMAQQLQDGPVLSFQCAETWSPAGTMDLAFCNGVFHHIPPSERHPCLVTIRSALFPGGLFAFWENNPWNPGTRLVMSRCAFDEHAITISPREARRILSKAGFRVLRTDFLFFFPHQLRWLRATEPWFRAVPLGGQYLVLCQNPRA